ncbi:MAG: T9SS type A sorting domain-containing protein, partial [Chitinophagales bacterium]|nr:T9SS type A sorting domain-containing protein [Chitinophagales bacterium]
LSADGCIDDYLNCNENLQIYTAISPPPQQWGANSPFLRALGGVTLNPAHQTATLTLNPNYTHLIKQGEALEIFNTQGRLVKTVPLSSGGETTTFSTANLISGIYYCRLQNHPEIEGVKMVVW